MTSEEDELRASLQRSAAQLRPPSGWVGSLDELLDRPKTPALTRPARRWMLPAIAAAVTALAVIPIGLLAFEHSSSTTAGTVSTNGSRATVGGISFPLPQGWQASTMTKNSDQVTVCIAAQPAAGGVCSGVTMTAAVPNALTGSFTPIADPSATAGDCRWVMLLDQAPIAGRPAGQYSVACTEGGPTSLSWYLTDGSLLLRTPLGEDEKQAEQIVDGLDLSDWAIHGGTPIVQITSSQSSPTTS